MTITRSLRIGLALLTVIVAAASIARAQDSNKAAILTFNLPVEVSGHVLPAGSYTFTLADSTADRGIVQIFNADQTQLIATVMSIPDNRLLTTHDTVIRFGEGPDGSPQALRAWFYPGNSVGQAFVYPKVRAAQLAKASNSAVPAITADAVSLDELKAATIVAIAPDGQESPSASTPLQTAPLQPAAAPLVATAGAAETPAAPAVVATAGTAQTTWTPVVATAGTMQITPPFLVGTAGATQTATPMFGAPVSTQSTPAPMMGTAGTQTAAPATDLPKTASSLPLFLSLGLGAIAAAAGLMFFGRHAFASAA